MGPPRFLSRGTRTYDLRDIPPIVTVRYWLGMVCRVVRTQELGHRLGVMIMVVPFYCSSKSLIHPWDGATVPDPQESNPLLED